MFQEGSEPTEFCTTHPGPPLRGVDEGEAAVPHEVHDTEAITASSPRAPEAAAAHGKARATGGPP
jgi:hypothetical protein